MSLGKKYIVNLLIVVSLLFAFGHLIGCGYDGDPAGTIIAIPPSDAEPDPTATPDETPTPTPTPDETPTPTPSPTS